MLLLFQLQVEVTGRGGSTTEYNSKSFLSKVAWEILTNSQGSEGLVITFITG